MRNLTAENQRIKEAIMVQKLKSQLFIIESFFFLQGIIDKLRFFQTNYKNIK
jgi:hypothetical protein